jgi:hypothetical protein
MWQCTLHSVFVVDYLISSRVGQTHLRSAAAARLGERSSVTAPPFGDESGIRKTPQRLVQSQPQ